MEVSSDEIIELAIQATKADKELTKLKRMIDKLHTRKFEEELKAKRGF